jgi:hypothetical protein
MLFPAAAHCGGAGWCAATSHAALQPITVMVVHLKVLFLCSLANPLHLSPAQVHRARRNCTGTLTRGGPSIDGQAGVAERP